MMSEVEVSIIIVNWNSLEFVRNCLKSLFENEKGEFEIIVVDGGSFDGCGKMLEESYPDVRFIQINDNVGFAKANNLAVKASRASYLLFLNPDTEIRADSISEMLRRYKSFESPGILGARLLNTDGSLQESCIQAFPNLANQLFNANILRRFFRNSSIWGTSALFRNSREPIPVEVISGACMLISRETFLRVGMFSEEYFMYSEDVDLSRKVTGIGLTNYYVPSAEIVHHGGGCTSDFERASATFCESRWRYFRKFKSKRYAACYRFLTCVVAVIRCALIFLMDNKTGKNRSLTKWVSIMRWAFAPVTK